MIFLHSILLTGLLAALLPLLIHLFSRMKKERIPFSSLYFLKRIEHRKLRRLKLRQLLLLFIRMAIIALLVIAFARPALIPSMSDSQKDYRLPGEGRVSAVIIIDNSLSTRALADNKPLFDLIKQNAQEVLKTVKDGDEIYVLSTTDIDLLYETAKIKPMNDKALALHTINTIQPSNKTANLSNALITAAQLISSSTCLHREIFLISDMQATNFPLSSNPLSERFDFGGKDIPKNVPHSPIRLYFIPPGEKLPGNIAISRIEKLNQIFETGKPITFQTTLRNFSETPAYEVPVSLYINGKRVAQRNVTINAFGSETIELQFIPEHPGIFEGMAVIDNDQLNEDNRRYCTFSVPEQISVLVIEENLPPNIFLKSALSQESETQCAIHYISESQLYSIDLNNYDVVIYNGFRTFAQSDIYRIKTFCAGGGSVILFPGDRSDLSSFNETISKAFSLPFANGLIGKTVISGTASEEYYLIDKIEWTHPLFSAMFSIKDISQDKHPAVNMPQIFKTVDFSLRGNARVIMTLTNKKPFLLESRIEQGTVLLFAGALSLEWSTLPLKGLFAPLVHQMIHYCASSGNTVSNDYIIGSPLSFSFNQSAETITASLPTGEQFKVRPNAGSGTVHSSFTETNVPGFYTIYTQNITPVRSGFAVSRKNKYAVNIDPQESDLRQIAPGEILTRYRKNNYKIVYYQNPGQNIAAMIQNERIGKEIGNYCIIAVLLFLIAETGIQYEKSGDDEANE